MPDPRMDAALDHISALYDELNWWKFKYALLYEFMWEVSVNDEQQD